MLALSRFLFTSSIVSSALAATINVQVGANGLAFTPNQVNAGVGDEILFEFHPKNHTLTQSSLAAPCVPLPGGGDSGFVPVAPGAAVFPTKRIIVNTTLPLWFHCKQGPHCPSGMVFAINPGPQEKMDTFLANAKASTPGGPPAGAPPPGTVSTPPPATTSVVTTSPAAGPSAPPAGAGKRIAIAVGQGGLTFTPDRATANIGDTVVFTFMGGNHTVTQSTFALPCSPSTGGVDSGFKPAAGSTTGPPTFEFPVTDISKPQWFYCKQVGHCPQGMVFSLNAPATGNTADAFKAAAMASGSGAGSPYGPGTPSATGTGSESTGTGPPDAGALSRFASGGTSVILAALVAGLLL